MGHPIVITLLHTLVDLLFPPLCRSCGNNSPGSPLCSACWELSRVIDPKERCIHCFEPTDTPLCIYCREKPKYLYPRAAVFDGRAPILQLRDEESVSAYAGFAYYQWQQLKWPEPDYIITLIPSSPIGGAFASLCNKPKPQVLQRKFALNKEPLWQLREGIIPEDAILLIFDMEGKPEAVAAACKALSEAFPKKIYVLSLFA